MISAAEVARVIPNEPSALTAFGLRKLILTSLSLISLFSAAATVRATPTISFTGGAFPATGSSVALASTPAGLTISVTAAPTAGSSITSVQFSINGVSLGAATGSSPFTINWAPSAAGSYTIAATVNDTSTITTGASASTNTATINSIVTIAAARAVTLLSPATGTTLSRNSQIFLRSTAAMSDSIVSKVDFILDPGTANTVIGTAVQSPYNVAYTVTAAVGAHTLLARATTSGGTTVDSTTTTINVATAVGAPPTIALSTSASGGVVAVNQNVTLSATASDTDGFIPATAGGGVTFFVDGDPVVPVGTGEINPDLIAPYSVTWKPTIAKTYSLQAQTVDDKNNIALSPVVSLVATAATVPPTVALTSPIAGATLNVGTPTTLAATATANAGATVTKVDFLSGTTVLGTSTAAPYTFAWTPIAAGAVSLTARVTDSNGAIVTSSAVSVTVVTSAPSISIVSPSNGASIALGTSTTITAAAAANGGATVARVDFFFGTTALGTSLVTPYTITWTPATGGINALTARVTDSNGSVVTSSIVNVSVTVPSVSLTSPANGSSFPVGTPVALAASASAVGSATVTKVDFFAGATLVDTALSAPYAGTWTPTATGSVSLTARVTDSNGAVVTSTATSVTITAAAAPTVSITAPLAGAIVGVGSNVTIMSTATPGAGATLAQVQFLVGTTIIGTVNSAPYSVTWTPSAAGNFSLTARALDSNNTSVTSTAVTVTAVTATSVSITSPAANSTASAGAATNITASAIATTGATISQVAFFADGVAIGSPVASAPFTIAWTPAATGSVLLTARATDSLGVSVTSAAVNINVTDTSAPTITLGASPGATTLPAGATRYLLASVTPSVGRAIARVEFFVDGTKVTEKTAAPYTYKFAAPAVTGATVVVARATDNAGLSCEAQLTLNVVTALGAAPTVALVAPAPNLAVVPNNVVNLAATATAPGGSVVSVQFYQNGVAIGNPVTASPFIGTFTPTAAGTYALEAIATDDRGNTAVSSPANLTVALGSPTVVLSAPRDGTRVTPAVSLTLTATAVGGSGASVALVEFFFDGALIGADTSSPYSIVFTPDASQLGAHQLTARVTDANSLIATSAVVNITIASVAGSPPTVSIVAPVGAAASNIQTLSSVNLVASAFDADGTIASVEFFLADISLGLAPREQTSNTYRLVYNFSNLNTATLTPNANGTYTLPLYALARDNSGNQSLSATTSLTLAPSLSSAPTVTIAATATNVTAGTTLQLNADAIDPDGSIASVQYFSNGTSIATSTAGPGFAVAYTPTSAGRFNVYGVATDDTGNTAVSSSVVIIVTGNTAPTVALVRPSDNATVANLNAPVFLEATASDADAGQMLNVVFLGNGAQIAAGQRVGTTNTYRAVWTPTVANSYTVAARATDSAGAQTTSTITRMVVVNNLVGLPPAIAINVPSSVTTSSTAVFTATATDADGTVTAVEFFVNRASIGQAVRDQTSNLWRITTSFGALPTGATEVVAIATDTSGNLAASATASVNVIASTSAAPAINIAADKTSVAFSQPVQLSANAFAADGSVTSVQYFANGVSIGSSTAAPGYLVSWTSTASGTFSVDAIATDNTGNTVVAAPLAITVKRSNPILDDDAFILQTYQDILARSPNPVELANYSAQLAAGTTTRAQFAGTLAADPSFASTANLCAAYYLLMNEWPTPTSYQTLYASRANLGTVVGLILGSNEYLFKYGPTTATTLNASFASAYTPFAARLWQTALGRGPSTLELVRFHDNDTASATLGRGYTVAGLNTAIAEFITLTNSNNVAFQKLARAAALQYQLLKTQPTAAQIATLAALPDAPAMAGSLLGSSFYSYRYVTIVSQPASLTVAAKSGALFRVEAIGQPPLAYQWLFNGAPIAGATAPLLGIADVDSTRTGAYTVVVTSAVASSTSDPALLTLSAQPTRLGNISTRGLAGIGSDVLTAGFVVAGSTTKQMLIRAIGPTLGSLGLAGFLADPRLDVLNSAGATIQSNDNWATQTGGSAAVTAIQQASTRLGAFTLPGDSLDAVVLATLNPGSYTVQARGVGTSTGVTLIEVYDASTALTGPKAINVSTRGNVGTGENILIAGFVVNGTVSRRVLIRGVGPTLANFGLPAAALLPNPQLKLLNAAGTTLATNDDWTAGDDAAIIASAATAAGAFPLANGSKDSAILIMLAPGAYTAQLSGIGDSNNTGIALVEVYDVDP